MNKIFALVFGGVLKLIGRNLAPMLIAWVIEATAAAENVVLTDSEALDATGSQMDPRALKQALRAKKRETALTSVKSHIPDLVEKVIPDKIINFFIELVVLARDFGILDEIQKVVANL